MNISSRFGTACRYSSIILALPTFCTFSVWAAPTFTSPPYVFTEIIGPNSAGFNTIYRFSLGVTVNDSLGVPENIDSVVAKALNLGQLDYNLSFENIGSIFAGLYDLIIPYSGQIGQWEIKATNKQNETVTGATNVLEDAHIIPLANNLRATGSLLAPTITWDPILFDDDYNPATPDVEVNSYRIRLLSSSNQQFYQSEPINGHSFNVPSGVIAPSTITYHIRLLANHLRNGTLENRSNTFKRVNTSGNPAKTPTHSDLDNNGTDDLTGLTSFGQIYYTTNLSIWTHLLGTLAQLRVGDLDGDGHADLAGLTSAGKIYYTTNLTTWKNIPGVLNQLMTGDLDGDGDADLAGITSAGKIYYTTNLTTWKNIPGVLDHLVVGDFNGDGQADLAGLTSAGKIYYTTNHITWINIPGVLNQLVAGDLDGDGLADLAGLTKTGQIYYTLNRSTWTHLPGVLGKLVTGDLNSDGLADLAGLTSNGTVWYTTNRLTWINIPGRLSRLVTGDFNSDGRADLAGLTDAGKIYYTTNLTNWVNIPGQLDRLAGDPD